MKSLLNDDPVFYGNSFSCYQKNKGGESHDPQPAQLKQNQDNSLTERSEVGGGILDYKTCNTDSGRGGKESINERYIARFCAERKNKKERAG